MRINSMIRLSPSPTPLISVAAAAHDGGRGGGGGVWIMKWNSEIPYLYAGLAMVMCLIAVALIMLTCSTVKDSFNGNEGSESSSSSNVINIPTYSEPKIVVIMAGDNTPTYLAKKQLA